MALEGYAQAPSLEENADYCFLAKGLRCPSGLCAAVKPRDRRVATPLMGRRDRRLARSSLDDKEWKPNTCYADDDPVIIKQNRGT